MVCIYLHLEPGFFIFRNIKVSDMFQCGIRDLSFNVSYVNNGNHNVVGIAHVVHVMVHGIIVE
jgi:hypothetical protein